MIVSIHQPGYLPWPGFFKKMLSSDVFVFFDDVQYVRSQWHNRNKIRTSDGAMWITVPVLSKFGDNLNTVKIDNKSNWAEKHKKALQINYSRAPYFKNYWNELSSIYSDRFELLIELNIRIIKFIAEKLQIKTRTIFSSELMLTGKGSDKILGICKALGADHYLAGALGKNYLRVEDFVKNNILVSFQNFQHPTYRQCYEPFIPNMTSIDLLFNEGKKASIILDKAKNFNY